MGGPSPCLSKTGFLEEAFAPALPGLSSVDEADAAAPAAGRAYEAFRIADIAGFISELQTLGQQAAHCPFQTSAWLVPFYTALAPSMGAAPVLVGVREKASGRIAMLLPLTMRRRAGCAIIEFADLDVCDYAFPLLGPAVPMTRAEAADAWRAVLACLPAADLMRLDRLLPGIGDTPNPLALLATRPSTAICNATPLPGSWEDYLGSCSKKLRKDLRQKTRAITQEDGATFRVVTEPEEASRVADRLDCLQRARLEEIGLPFKLDRPPYSTFYREAIRIGVTDGTLRIAVLEANGEVIAAAMMLLTPGTGTIVRLSHAAGIWSRRSPSMVLAGCVIKWLIEAGYANLDFGTGLYAYKQRLGCEPLPLLMVEQPLTVKGRLLASALAAERALRTSPTVRALVARLRRGRGTAAGAD